MVVTISGNGDESTNAREKVILTMEASGPGVENYNGDN